MLPESARRCRECEMAGRELRKALDTVTLRADLPCRVMATLLLLLLLLLPPAWPAVEMWE